MMSNSWRVRARVPRYQSISDLRSSIARFYSRVHCFADRNFDHAKRQLLGKRGGEHGHRDVEHGRAVLRSPFQRSAMRVAVEDSVHPVSIERLFESRRAEEGDELRRLAFDRGLDRRGMQHTDLLR